MQVGMEWHHALVAVVAVIILAIIAVAVVAVTIDAFTTFAAAIVDENSPVLDKYHQLGWYISREGNSHQCLRQIDLMWG